MKREDDWNEGCKIGAEVDLRELFSLFSQGAARRKGRFEVVDPPIPGSPLIRSVKLDTPRSSSRPLRATQVRLSFLETFRWVREGYLDSSADLSRETWGGRCRRSDEVEELTVA